MTKQLLATSASALKRELPFKSHDSSLRQAQDRLQIRQFISTLSPLLKGAGGCRELSCLFSVNRRMNVTILDCSSLGQPTSVIERWQECFRYISVPSHIAKMEELSNKFEKSDILILDSVPGLQNQHMDKLRITEEDMEKMHTNLDSYMG